MSRFLNHSDSTNNDRCPECRAEIEPERSEDAGDGSASKAGEWARARPSVVVTVDGGVAHGQAMPGVGTELLIVDFDNLRGEADEGNVERVEEVLKDVEELPARSG